MRILDENGLELESPDLEKGYLKNDRILVCHHVAIEEIEEVGHFETVAEYPNGGKDVAWVVDIPGVAGREAWDEYEEILRYIAYTEAELRLRELEELRRPLDVYEVMALLLPRQINTLEVDDQTALRMRQYYPEWAAGVSCPAGFKVQREGKLYRAAQAHTSQIGWEPENAPALWVQIDEIHAGSEEDPIPYEGNMVLTAGLYYYQAGKLYRCTRDTGAAVHHPLAELVGLYVEQVN